MTHTRGVQGELGDCWLLSGMGVLADADARAGSQALRDVIIHSVGDRGAAMFGHTSMHLTLAVCAVQPFAETPSGDDGRLPRFYAVRFYSPAAGRWERIVVDDYFPVKPVRTSVLLHALAWMECNSGWHAGNTSAVVRTPTPLTRPRALVCGLRGSRVHCAKAGRLRCACVLDRVLVVEKAYAKFCQSRLGYQALDAGLVQDGLVSFTGGASEEIELGDAQPGLLWRKLFNYHVGVHTGPPPAFDLCADSRVLPSQRLGYLMGCGTPAGKDDIYSSRNGIVQGHAYGLLQVTQVVLSGVPLRMVKVRNPWGSNPSTAAPLDWSPSSPTWRGPGAEYMKVKLNYDPTGDGTSSCGKRAASELVRLAELLHSQCRVGRGSGGGVANVRRLAARVCDGVHLS